MGRDGGSRLIFYRTLNLHYSFCVGVIAFVLISSTSDSCEENVRALDGVRRIDAYD
jgi:hypothetical protein